MHRLLSWYNQNRLQVIIVALLIAFIFIILRVLNGFAEKEFEQKKSESSLRNNSINVEQSTIASRVNQSVLTGEKISEQTSNSNQKVIKQFIKYCNDVKVEDAYAMLSDECKEALYPTLRDFVTYYYLNIFYITRIYSLENWFQDTHSYTYYVKYTEDVLATGNVNSKDNRSDYITVIYDDSGAKLNIGNYVGRKALSNNITKNNVTLTVNWIDYYIDYNIVNVSVSNNTLNKICLDSKEDVESAFIYDENNIRFEAFLNEIADNDLVIESGKTVTLNIKFGRSYNPERGIRGVAFCDVVLNYDNYTKGLEKKSRITLNT